jgi:hypothetical protein
MYKISNMDWLHQLAKLTWTKSLDHNTSAGVKENQTVYAYISDKIDYNPSLGIYVWLPFGFVV